MPDSNVDIRIRLLQAAKFRAEADASAASVERLGATSTRTGKAMAVASGGMMRFAKHGEALRSMGRSMTSHVTVPILGIAAAAVKFGTDFDRTMELVHTQAGASQGEIKRLRNQVLDLASKSPQGPDAVADSLRQIESTGLRGAKAMHVLRTAVAGATIGNANLTEVTHSLVSATASGMKGTQSVTQTMRTMNAVIGVGNLKMDDLAAAMGTGIMNAAKPLGVSFQQIGASLAALADAGEPAAQAASRLRMSLSLLAAPSKTASKELAKIGISGTQMGLAMVKGGPIASLELLRTGLNKYTKGMGPAMAKTKQFQILSRAFGGGRSSGAILALLGGMNEANFGVKAKYAALLAAMRKGSDGLTKSQQQDAVKLKTAWSKVQSALVHLSDHIRPALVPLATFLAGTFAKIVKVFGGLPKPVRAGVLAFVGLAAAAGPVLLILGHLGLAVTRISKAYAVWKDSMFATRLGLIYLTIQEKITAIATKALAVATGVLDAVMDANPIMLVVTALVALGAGFVLAYKKVGWFRNAVQAVWHWIKGHWPLLLSILTGPIGAAVIYIVTHFHQVLSFVKGLPGKIAHAASGMWDGIKNGLKSVIHWVIQQLNNLVNLAQSIPGKVASGVTSLPGKALHLLEGAVPWGAEGGVVTSPGLMGVGERGPEILSLPRGASVTPLPTGGGGWGDVPLEIHVHSHLDGRELAHSVSRTVARKAARR